MRMIRASGAVLLLSCLLLSAGCWDRVEIEEIGFVTGVAVDLSDQKEAGKAGDGEDKQAPKGLHRFVGTFHFVVPEPPQGEGGDGPGKDYLIMSAEGESMLMISRHLAARTSRLPFFEHLKMIIVSEELAQEKRAFANTIDFFLRDHEMRRGTKVLIARGKARELLEFRPPIDKRPVQYIDSVTENVRETAHMLPELKIGDLHEHLLRHESFAVPYIHSDHQQAKVSGAAIFHGRNNVMAGALNEEETAGLNFVTNKTLGGMLKIQVQDNLLIFDIMKARRELEAEFGDDGEVRFALSINVEGVIPEAMKQVDFMDPAIIANLERLVEKEIERICMLAVEKLQKNFKTDALGFGNYLRRKHYARWQSMKDDWEEGKQLFVSSGVEIKAKAVIRRTGTVNRTE